MDETGEGANGTLPEVELIIKASTIDGKRKGACLFCHEYFMDLYLLAELKTISLKITTVDMLKPPPDFRSNFEATPPPILIDNGQYCSGPWSPRAPRAFVLLYVLLWCEQCSPCSSCMLLNPLLWPTPK